MDRFGIQEPEHVLNLGVDETAKSYMLETARWGKFLAILSIIGISLLIIVSIASVFFLSNYSEADLATAGAGIGALLVYCIIGALYLYPIISLYKFSRYLKSALDTYNKEQFNTAFRHLRNIFKFMGILTIISLGLSGITLVLMIIGAAFNA